MGRRPTVIKADKAGVLEARALKSFSLADMMTEAREMVAAKQREATAIIEQAGGEAEVIREAAKEEGYRAGLEAGTREGREAGRAKAFESATREFAEQHGSLIESCQQTISGIDAGRADWEASARRDLIDLAMAIARRVVRHVGQREREVVLANLEEAIRLAGSRSEVTIMVNSADGEAARQFAKSLVDMREQWKHVRVMEESEVSPGGCRIQWNSGAVDARLETQLDRIEAELMTGSEAANDSQDGSEN